MHILNSLPDNSHNMMFTMFIMLFIMFIMFISYNVPNIGIIFNFFSKTVHMQQPDLVPTQQYCYYCGINTY